jgi:hypothetical protein
MQRVLLFALLAFVIAGVGCRQTQTPSAGRPAGSAAGENRFDITSSDAYFETFQLKPAPSPAGLLLKRGDRLAICGDSITEQKMYSRIIETYLTVCVPELEITARQYGWSGERAPGFLARMTNDCLRFHPTMATTCYGMNDHEYRPYEERIGKTYREQSTAVVRAFKANGARVIQGSPGCVGKMPGWVKTASGTVEDLNLSLCQLRNIGIEIARRERVGFADVFWPMLTASFNGQQRYGTNFCIPGQDGVHPGWAGQTIMAYAFLKSFGLNGDIGSFTVDLRSNRAKVSKGHELLWAKDGEFKIKSSQYPFCATGDTASDSSIRAAMLLIPFNQELNRLVLVANHGRAASYKVSWGAESRMYSADQLARGVNLAEEFTVNPFSEAFKTVDDAVATKQNYETKQIKEIFHGPEGQANIEAAAAKTEAARQPLAAAIKAAFKPVTHTLKIEPN